MIKMKFFDSLKETFKDLSFDFHFIWKKTIEII